MRHVLVVLFKFSQLVLDNTHTYTQQHTHSSNTRFAMAAAQETKEEESYLRRDVPSPWPICRGGRGEVNSTSAATLPDYTQPCP